MRQINYLSIAINASPGDEYSMAVPLAGTEFMNFHRLLRIKIGEEGSLYLTLMRIKNNEWQVGDAPYDNVTLTREFDSSKIRLLGTTIAPKISFHASGAINLGDYRTYRPPIRTLSNLEQLCLIHYGNPDDLPSITLEEFNAWQKEKGHPLLPLPPPLPGSVIATRIFVSAPKSFEAHQQMVCSDFELIQQSYIFRIRGLSNEFPRCTSGDYGYDLLLGTGLWSGENWHGPLIVIPATYPKDDPEASRKEHKPRQIYN